MQRLIMLHLLPPRISQSLHLQIYNMQALHDDAHKELKPISCNAQALVMHVTCKTIVTIVGQTHSHLGFSKCARRCHTDIGFKRSLLAFAEREKGEQPWSADQANQRWGHTPY